MITTIPQEGIDKSHDILRQQIVCIAEIKRAYLIAKAICIYFLLRSKFVLVIHILSMVYGYKAR